MKIVKDQVLLGAREKEAWLEAFRRFCDPERVILMDIETTGFSRAYDSVYLTGFLYFENGSFYIEQHLATNRNDEPAVVEAYYEKMQDQDVIITFNGDMFDLPFMENRARVLHVQAPQLKAASVDLYRRYRPLAAVFGWENCKLKTIERFLGIDREDTFSGGELIDVFEEYAVSGDEALEKVLLLHNYEDILNLPRLLRVDDYADCLRASEVEELSLEKTFADRIVLRAVLSRPACLSHEGEGAYPKMTSEVLRFRTEAGSPVMFLTLPLIQGLFYHYLPDPENYFYLPESDSIIHKALADTAPGVKKKKATSKNCRIAREGCFVPAWGTCLGLHAFQREKKQPVIFLEEQELLLAMEKAEGKERTDLFHQLFQI